MKIVYDINKIGYRCRFGDYIKAKRKELGYTLRGFACVMCVSPSTLSRWENDKADPTATNIYYLALNLCISVNDLYKQD